MVIGFMVVIAVLGSLAVAAILIEPSAARLLADVIESRAKTAVSILRSHAEARQAARMTYRRVYRFCRTK